LLAKKRENHSIDEGMGHNRGDTSLARRKHTRASDGREGQEHTGAEERKEETGDDEVGVGENNVHAPRDEAIKNHKDQSMDKDGRDGRLTALEGQAGELEEESRAEEDEKNSGDKNLGTSDINHFVYCTQIINFLDSKAV